MDSFKPGDTVQRTYTHVYLSSRLGRAVQVREDFVELVAPLRVDGKAWQVVQSDGTLRNMLAGRLRTLDDSTVLSPELALAAESALLAKENRNTVG